MKQRLLIARALIHNPKVLLLDEPTRSLDPITAHSLRTFLKETIAGQHNCAVLIATHDPEEALDFCDSVAILDRGRLVCMGAPRALSDALIGARYRIWTSTPEHGAFDAYLRDGVISSITVVDRTTKDVAVDVRINIQTIDTADLLAGLVGRGARISRFEKSPLGLAELIHRAITGPRPEPRA
jgi:ABC-type multidrug transport system ATPase subunit